MSMLNVKKILLFMCAILLLFCNIAFATDNSADDETSAAAGNRVNGQTSTSANTTAGVTTTQSGIDSSSLNISNILSVILIAVGALIIFLSIAILIRMNR